MILYKLIPLPNFSLPFVPLAESGLTWPYLRSLYFSYGTFTTAILQQQQHVFPHSTFWLSSRLYRENKRSCIEDRSWFAKHKSVKEKDDENDLIFNVFCHWGWKIWRPKCLVNKIRCLFRVSSHLSSRILQNWSDLARLGLTWPDLRSW